MAKKNPLCVNISSQSQQLQLLIVKTTALKYTTSCFKRTGKFQGPL